MSDQVESSKGEFWRDADDGEALQHYRTLLETLDEGVFQLYPDGRFAAVNDRFVEVTGDDRADLVGSPVSTVLTDAGSSRVEQRISSLRDSDTDGAATVEVSVQTAAGDAIPCELRLNLLESDGEFRGTVGIVSDAATAENSADFEQRNRQLEQPPTEPETEVAETFDRISDAFYALDEEFRFQHVNEQAEEVMEYSEEELLGQSLWEVFPEIARDSVFWEEFRAAMETQEPASFEYAAEGFDAWLEFNVYPSETGLSVYFQDVTERKEYEQALEESERRYRTLVENFPNGAVGLFDENLEYTAVGGEFLDTADIDPADRVGQRVTEIYPEEIVAEMEPNFRAALEGESNSFEVEFHDRHLFAHTMPVESDDGDVFAGMLVVQDVTESREAQRELRESEAKFRMLAENLDEIVWMASADGEEFVYLNPAFEAVWGIDREQLYEEPLSFLEAVHPDDRERVRDAFTALPGGEFDEEFRIRRPDGEVRWVHARGSRVEDEDGDIARIVGIGQDVTEQKERERALEESERRYRALADHFPNGVVGVYDRDLRYTLAAGEKLGDPAPSADEVEGTRMPDLYPDDAVADLEPLFRAAVEDGETGSIQTEVVGRTWQVWATPVRNADGEIFAGLSFAQDITEQDERERELERALDLLEKTERIADVGGWEIDVETEEVFWTDHVFDLLEIDADEEPPLGEALDMYHDEDQPIVEEAVEQAMASGDPFDVEVRLVTGTGTLRWLRLQGAPETVDGEVVSFRGAAQDVTERKQREQRLEELVDRLEESNKRLEQFAYAASHDLQEPLRMVSSYLQLIEERYADELDEDGREFIDFAVDGADRMRDMIDGLLQYSRVETEGDEFGPVDLEPVLEDAREDLQVKIEESDAEITTAELPLVEGDEGQLRQVFQNLIDNAIEYSGDEPPRIHVSADRTGPEWTVSVADEGIGIQPDEQDQIFEVFQRLHTNDESSGTGIGLALCERIIERHGGDIWVDSVPGEGTTFSFTLPAVREGSDD